MNRRLLLSLILFGVALVPPALGHALRAEDVPKADEKVLRALAQGAEELRIIVGVADGTPGPRALWLEPDAAGEPARRVRRLAAQHRLAGQMPDTALTVRHYYASFSMLAGRASREGVVALANHPQVSWVTVDGTRRALQQTPQAAQLLMNSNQSNLLGYTGAGQTVAVIDTGVDYTTAALGGGGFPNAKVIGGFDTADEDADPLDCEGHGTSVAAVIAGSTGVAPDARIVALKVFASTSPTNDSCREEAFDSDIIQGVNFAVSRRAEFGITAINLSLGGNFDDVEGGADLGYCDARVPAYAAAFDAATAAGLVVVVASGNDALTRAVSTPSCVSSAISVGAVYSQSQASQGWSDGAGGTLCRDTPVTPDLITCFSNSTSTLSLLAPGAFWNVVTKGGVASRFAGTSASAPAVAGAVAILRQARPELTPAAVAAILRATGRPVLDSRNGVVIPRVDTLAALRLAPAHFALAADSQSIPDGTGFAFAEVTIAGIANPIANVQAAIQIDHPAPPQLRVTLTGPDGTSVVLHDHSGTFDHPLNSNYGGADPLAALALFQGRSANGTWRLTVEDTVAGFSGRIRSFAIAVVPGQPLEAIPQRVDASVLPIVAHVQGTKLFKSDVRLYNPSPAPRDFTLFYVPAGQTGARASRVNRTVAAGAVLALDDVIRSEYGFSDSIGQMTIVSPAGGGFIATSRAYTESGNGSFGLFVPGFRSASGLSSGSGSATANGLVKNAQFHTNVGFTEVSGEPVTVRMDVYDAGGAPLASRTASTAPNTAVVIVDIIGDRGLPHTSNFRVDYTVTSAGGRIVPFATYVDDVTGDAIFQPARSATASSDDVIVTQAAHVIGANDDFFRTNLHVTNLEAFPVTVTVTLVPLVLTGTPPEARVYTLAAGQTLERPDVLRTEFGLGNPSAAGLRIRPSVPARLAVSTRTAVEKFGGTFGYFIPGASAGDALAAGGGTATAIQLEHAPASTGRGFRSNVGFAEIAGGVATVRVTLRSGDTGGILGARSYTIGPHRLFQASVAEILGADASADNVYAQFLVESGLGRVLPYATVVDNKSGDAIYVPAQKEP